MTNNPQNLVFNGLSTGTINIPAAGVYTFQGNINLPQNNPNPSSSVVCTIKQNGTTQYTGSAGYEGFTVTLTCAANDVITFVLSSANAVDQGLNVIKTTVSVS